MSGLQKIGAALDSIKAKAIGAKVAAAALNAALAMGVSWAVGSLSTAVSNWLNRNKIAAEEAEELKRKQIELREQTLANAEAYEENEKALASLVAQYAKLLNSVDDVNSIRDELSKLQDDIIEKYGDEADGIDLVNKGLRENIDLLTKLQEKENSRWLVENSSGVKDAERFFKNTETGLHRGAKFNKAIYNTSELAQQEAHIYVSTIEDYLKEHYPDVLGNITKLGDFGFGVADSASYKEQIAAVDALVEAYDYAFEARDNFIYYNTDAMRKAMYDWQEKFHKFGDVLDEAAKRQGDSEIFEDFKKNTEVYNQYLDLLDKAYKYNEVLNDENETIADRTQAGFDLEETISSLKDIANQYPVTADIIKEQLSELGISFNGASTTIENTKETWLKSLDEAQKGILSNVDKITSAMAKLTSGEAIDSKAAWDIINLDDNKLLSNISIDANGDYIFDLEQIVKLKDEILQKEIETREESIKTAKQNAKTAEENIKVAESQIYALRPRMAAAYDSGDKEFIAELEAEYESLKRTVESNRSSLEAYNYTIRNESLYVTELKKRRGDLTNTVDMLKAKVEQLKKAVSNLEKEAEARLKAQEHVIDGIIDKFQKEADELEKQKEVLDEQLETLEKQKDELDEIIGNYKTVSDFVSNTIENQIDDIEDSKSKIEEYYDSLIEKLKEENEERQDAIDKEEKLAALANAQNNKVRYYDAERGWTYGVDQDALKKAQNDLDKTLNDEQIKDFEKQKKEEIAPLEEQIKALKEWSKEWGDATNFVTEAENELLAEEILGSDWREKIKSKDIATLDAFKARYKNYNESLKNIVNTEMKSLKDSIKAKEDEIAVKKKQIQAWQDYKSEVQSAANDIKNGLEGYVSYLDTVKLTEASTNQERLNNLNSFTTAYSGLIQTITSYNTQIDETNTKLNSLGTTLGATAGVAQESLKQVSDTVSNYASKLGEVDDMMDSLFPETNNSSGGFLGGISGIGNSMSTLNKPIEDLIKEIIKIFQKSIFDKIPHYAEGGVNTTTGFAWMDGTKANPELILNSADISRLY